MKWVLRLEVNTFRHELFDNSDYAALFPLNFVHFSFSEGCVFIAEGLELIWNKVHDVIKNYIYLEDFLFCVLDKNC